LVYPQGSGPRAVWGLSGRPVGAAGGVSPHRRCVPRRCATPWRGPLGGAVRWTAFGERGLGVAVAGWAAAVRLRQASSW